MLLFFVFFLFLLQIFVSFHFDFLFITCPCLSTFWIEDNSNPKNICQIIWKVEKICTSFSERNRMHRSIVLKTRWNTWKIDFKSETKMHKFDKTSVCRGVCWRLTLFSNVSFGIFFSFSFCQLENTEASKWFFCWTKAVYLWAVNNVCWRTFLCIGTVKSTDES